MKQTFSIAEALRFGWQTLRAHSGILFQALLTVLGVQVVYALVSRVLPGTLLGIIAQVVLIVLEVVIAAGLTRILISLSRHKPATYGELFPPGGIVLNYFLASLLSGVIVLLPLLVGVCLALVTSLLPSAVALLPIIAEMALAVGASLYLLLRYFFVKFAAVDGSGITDSLRRSALITRGHKGRLILFALALIGINILGLLALIVGLIVSIPVSLLAVAYVYQTLLRIEGKA